MLEIQIDRYGERDVPVAARIEIPLPAAATWSGEWHADPAHVHVRGPRSVVAKLDSLRLAPVRIDAARDTFKVVASPAAPPGCQLVPSVVTLRVPVTRAGH